MSLSRPVHGVRPAIRVALAAVLVAALVAGLATVLGGNDDPAPAAGSPAAALAPLEGIPQDGFTLGRAGAPVTATVYAYLGTFDRGINRALPTLIDRYVRDGRLKLQLRALSTDPAGVTFGTADGAAAAQAAGLQDRLWAFYRLLYAAHPGYLSVPDIATAAADVPGLDNERWTADLRSRNIAASVRRNDARARSAGVTAAPSVILRRDGERAVRTRITSERVLQRAVARYMR